MVAMLAGAYPASPTPVKARAIRSCEKLRVKAQAKVARDQMATIRASILRRLQRSTTTDKGITRTAMGMDNPPVKSPRA